VASLSAIPAFAKASARSDEILTNEGAQRHKFFNSYSKLQIDLIGVDRKSLKQLHRTGEASEEIMCVFYIGRRIPIQDDEICNLSFRQNGR
jgi:hypothetical protein